MPALAIGGALRMTGSTRKLASRRIGFVSTRFSGTDGVSLETTKWATVLERLGHTCYYFCGLSDRPPERSRVVPEAFFGHPAVAAISRAAFDSDGRAAEPIEFSSPALNDEQTQVPGYRLRPPHLTEAIRDLAAHLEKALYAFVREFDVELLVVENALAIPMNIPLGVALTEFIAETGLPTIAHHHDFYWERQRYLISCVADYLSMAFPPVLPAIRHVVISSIAGQELSRRYGVASTLVPNVMDFDNPPAPPDDYARDVREALGVLPGEALILQPTRVIPRKGIEHAIELTRRLELGARLIVSHAAGDEGSEYEQRVREFAELLSVPVNFVSGLIDDRRGQTPDGRKIYTLADVYPHADLVTYPSKIEGFGNAFLEATYFTRPIVVNAYSIYEADIKPKGFRVIEMSGYVTRAALENARRVLQQPDLAREMAEHNFRLGQRHYAFRVLERRLQTLIAECFGENDGYGW
jgi:glycosyltransferase involved in cell wall biosynthesis